MKAGIFGFLESPARVRLVINGDIDPWNKHRIVWKTTLWVKVGVGGITFFPVGSVEEIFHHYKGIYRAKNGPIFSAEQPATGTTPKNR